MTTNFDPDIIALAYDQWQLPRDTQYPAFEQEVQVQFDNELGVVFSVCNSLNGLLAWAHLTANGDEYPRRIVEKRANVRGKYLEHPKREGHGSGCGGIKVGGEQPRGNN